MELISPRLLIDRIESSRQERKIGKKAIFFEACK
jgi:hypothetical protein